MSAVFSGQGRDGPTRPPSRADEKLVVEQVGCLRLASSESGHGPAKGRGQPTKQRGQQQQQKQQQQHQQQNQHQQHQQQKQHQQREAVSFPAQRHAPVQVHRPRPRPRPPALPLPLPSLSIFHPRSLEEIYAEQAYLSLTLQSHSSRLCDLVSTYHQAEADSIHGESRKIKRRARRQIGLLRTQIRHAAEQEQTIYLRLSDLLIEAKSRAALDLTPNSHAHRRGVGPPPPAHSAPSGPASRLNGATAEFVPDTKSPPNKRADSGVGVFPDTEDDDDDDAHGPLHSEHKDYQLSPTVTHTEDMADPGPGPADAHGPSGPSPRLDPQYLAVGHWKLDALMLRRQASMPDIRASFLV
ncbi:hypothetical protein E4U54_005252 [Claviceps lovelessii]|nr:hypothetical protein E4U54_005252 [Claviceps lovelessii]